MQLSSQLPVEIIDRLRGRCRRMIAAIVILGLLLEVIVVVCVLVSGGVFSGRQIANLIYLALLAAGAAGYYGWMSQRLIRYGQVGSAEAECPEAFPYLTLIEHSLLGWIVQKWLPVHIVLFRYGECGRRVFQLIFADEEVLCDEQGHALVVIDPSMASFHRCLLTRPKAPTSL